MDIKINPIGVENSTLIEEQMPLKVLVLSDLTPNAPEMDTPVNINKNNFNEVMHLLCPQLNFCIPNKIDQTPKEIMVKLEFRGINSFCPEQIIPQVSVLSELMEIRDLLVALGKQELSGQEFVRRIKNMKGDSTLLSQFHTTISSPAAVSSPEPATKNDPLDSLFEMVEIPTGTMPGKSGIFAAFDNLIAQIVQPQPTGVNQLLEIFIGEIDALLNSQLNEILHQPKFQSLESAWRGLKFLIDNTNFHKNIRIEILNVSKEQLRDIIYTHVFKPEYDKLTPTPLSVMIGDYQFDRLPQDIELFKDISKMAQSLQVPFITSTAPEFFGLKSFIRLPALPMLKEKFNGPEYIKWNSFRKTEESLWVVLTVNRFLLREPYKNSTNLAEGFMFEEQTNESRKYLWANAVWAIGSILVADFAENGWCINSCGQKTEEVLNSLPTHEYQVNQTQKTIIPLEILMPEQKQPEFAEMGMSLLACRTDSTSAFVHSMATTHFPEKYKDMASTSESISHATLSYQLFAGRLSHYLNKIEINTDLSPEEMEKVLHDKVLSFISLPDVITPDECVAVQITASKEQPGSYDIVLRVQPVFKILNTDIDLLLEWSMVG